MTKEKQAELTLLDDLRALENCPELAELEQLIRQFNIFRVLRLEDAEIRHSNLLAWLFQPHETHGLGALFLTRLLVQVVSESGTASPAGFRKEEIEMWSITQVEVFREWKGLDILLKIDTATHGVRVVAIENKLRASQSAGQLSKYRHQVVAGFPGAKILFVFLTKQDEVPEDSAFLGARHHKIHEVLAGCLREKETSLDAEPRVLLKHYLGILEDRNMGNQQITLLAKQINLKHRRALDEILRLRTDGVQQMGKLVGDLVARAGPEIVPMVNQRAIVRFIPAEWNTAQNRAGTAWEDKDSAYVLCEILVSGSHPWLSVVDGQSPMAWKSELCRMAEERQFPIESGKPAPERKWMRVFAVQCPIPIEHDHLHSFDEKAEKVWEWCRQRMAQADFKGMVQAVALHLGKLPRGQ